MTDDADIRAWQALLDVDGLNVAGLYHVRGELRTRSSPAGHHAALLDEVTRTLADRQDKVSQHGYYSSGRATDELDELEDFRDADW